MMKTLYKFLGLLLIGLIVGQGATAQDKESKLKLDFGADLVSRYIWRGTDFGNTPSVQPGFTLAIDKFEIGAWGNYGLSSNTGSLEADLFASYSFDFGLGIIVTDYYFPGESTFLDKTTNNIVPVRAGNYFDYENAHTIELGLSYEIKNLTVSGYYMIEGDSYGEVSYALGNTSVFVGAGDGAYTVDGDFNVCNVGLGYSKEVAVSDKYKLPLFGQFILNPSTEQVHLVFGLSF